MRAALTSVSNSAPWQMGWTSRHAKTLDDLLQSLNGRGIRYFILRNYEGLPNQNPSKDVDIIVEPGRYHEAAETLLDAYGSNGFTRAFTVRYERAHCWYGFALDERTSIHVDLIAGYSNKGFEYLTFDELYSHTVTYGNYKVLSDDLDILMLILYKVVGVGELKDRYCIEIADKFPSVKESLAPVLAVIFGPRWGAWLFGKLETGAFDDIVAEHGSLSRASKLRALGRHPLGTSSGIVRFIAEKADRMVLRPGCYRRIVAVEAPDGTGKSTFIDVLASKISSAFLVDESAVIVRHFRPNLFPNLGAVGQKAGVAKQDTDFTHPHRNAPSGPFGSFLRMAYYWLDYCLGGFVIARKDAQFGSFGIFDRYIYDFLVDPLRSRVSLPYGVRKAFCRLTYQPQVTFVLRAEAETVFSRKPELELDEIRRQNREFARLRDVARGYVEVDAEQSPEDMANDAVQVLVTAFTSKVGELRG